MRWREGCATALPGRDRPLACQVCCPGWDRPLACQVPVACPGWDRPLACQVPVARTRRGHGHRREPYAPEARPHPEVDVPAARREPPPCLVPRARVGTGLWPVRCPCPTPGLGQASGLSGSPRPERASEVTNESDPQRAKPKNTGSSQAIGARGSAPHTRPSPPTRRPPKPPCRAHPASTPEACGRTDDRAHPP